MKKPVLSILIPSVDLGEILDQITEVTSQSCAFGEKIEVITKLDKVSMAGFIQAEEAAKETGALALPMSNEGFDRDIGKLIKNANGQFLWLVSSNDRLDTKCLYRIMPLLESGDYDLVFLNSRTQGGEYEAITVESDLQLTGLGPVLRTVGTRMSLVTSIIFKNSSSEEVSKKYEKYSNSAIAFLVHPLSLIARGGMAYVVKEPLFTNLVKQLKYKESSYYDNVFTFGRSLWDITSEFQPIGNNSDVERFLCHNFGHLWRGLILDWLRRGLPRPTAQLWSIRCYRISSEYWPALFLSLLPKSLVRLGVWAYKLIVKKSY